MNGIVFGIVAASVFWHLFFYDAYAGKLGIPETGSDFRLYADASQGQFHNGQVIFGYLYNKSLAPIFGLFTLRTWYALMLGSYLIVVLLALRIEWGWAVVLITLKPFLMVIDSGNIAPFLVLCCVWPAGVVVATLFKPYCAGFLVLHAAGAYIRQRRATGDAHGHSRLSALRVDNPVRIALAAGLVIAFFTMWTK